MTQQAVSQRLMDRLARHPNHMLVRTTDPNDFLNPHAGRMMGYMEEPPRTLRQAFENQCPVMTGTQEKDIIGMESPDYELMLAGKIRSLTGNRRKTIEREEALAHLLMEDRQSPTLEDKMDLGANDAKADPEKLRRHLDRMMGSAPPAPRTRETPAGNREPVPPPPPQEPYPDPVPPKPSHSAPPRPIRENPPHEDNQGVTKPQTTIIVSTVMGNIRFPVIRHTTTDTLLVLLQDASGFGWSPGDTETIFNFRIGQESIDASWTGIDYELDGVNHAVFLLEG